MTNELNPSSHIARYFCDFDKRNRVSLDAPSIWQQVSLEYPPSDNDSIYPKRWNSYNDAHSIVLLGPPRAGKTTEFKFQCSQCRNGFMLELRDVDFDDEDLVASWSDIERDRWEAFLGSDIAGDLFIDSLDEGRQETAQAAKKVVKWLRKLSASVGKRLRVHISCRELEWERIDQAKWDALFPPTECEHNGKKEVVPSYVKLALLPLGHAETMSYMEEVGVNGHAFYRVLPRAAERLTRWPQTLRMLVELFARDGVFGKIDDIYQHIIEKRIQESNEYRVRDVQVPLTRRIRLARELSVISILSGREIIALREIEGISQFDAGLVAADVKELMEVAGSELFERYSDGKVRFEDHTLAAFLAAQWILKAHAVNGISATMIESLLYTDSMAGEIVPALRMLAGWLAILSPEVRCRLLERSPGLLLSNDFPEVLSDEVKMELWRWMKREFGAREWFNNGVYSDNAGKLVCPDVISDVGDVLRQKDEYGRDLRLYALEILSKGRVKDYDDLLISLILDDSEDLMIRRYTLTALEKISPEKLPMIKPLLEASTEGDPDLDLLGNALFHLFPEHLSVDEVIAQLNRSKDNHHLGMYQLFVRNVAEKSSANDRAIILEYLAEKLSEYLDMRKKHQGAASDWLHTFEPALEFGDFLLPQLKEWGELPERFPLLENWLHLLANANAYGLIRGHNLKEISDLLEASHELRRQLGVIRIERLFEIKGEAFKPYDVHAHDRLYHSKPEDLKFWMQMLIAWADQPVNKLEAVWEELCQCWVNAEYPTDVLDWLEMQSEAFPSIAELWGREKFRELPEGHLKYRQKRVLKRKEKERGRKERFKAIQQAVPKIEQGHQDWLEHIVSYIPFEENIEGDLEAWLEAHVGRDVSNAFAKGLNAYWLNSEAPEISMYASNQLPWWSSVIIMAVEKWLAGSGDWNGLASELRQRAIRAALWSCDVPAWFFGAVNEEQKWASSFFYDVLSVEDEAGNDLHRVLYLFSGHGEEMWVREVVISFLLSKERLRIQTLKQALRLLCENAEDFPLDDTTLDQLWAIAQKYAESDEDEHFQLLAAAVFRFRQMDVWRVVGRRYLSDKQRVVWFQGWLNSIAEINMRFRLEGKWPAWMSEESIAAMLPDMFEAFPLNSDPTIDERNDGQMYRGDMGRLRNHGISVLAESGSEFAGKQLMVLLNAPFVPDSMHSLILDCIDIWKGKRAQRAWVPLKPEDVKRVLKEEAQPIRSSEELFKFVCDLLEGVQKDIESGEEELRNLLWNETSPKIEKDFQSLVARLLRYKIEAKKLNIVSGRELDIQGNFPDLFTTCILPDENRSRVFIEMKRQQFYEKKPGQDASTVLSSIKTQLIDKYLADADTSYGMYIVGWYGVDYFGSYKTRLRKLNKGVLPTNSKDFETILQKIANDDVRKSKGVDGVRVFVVDLELNS